MTDNSESDLHIIEHWNIYQHVLKQNLHMKKSWSMTIREQEDILKVYY